MGTCGGNVAAAGFLLWADLPHGPSKRMLVQEDPAQCVQWDSLHTSQHRKGAHPPGPQLQGGVEGLARGKVARGDKNQITLVALGW